MFYGCTNPVPYFLKGFYDIGLSLETLAIPAISLLILGLYDFFSLKTDVIEWISSKNIIIRYGIYFTMLIFIMLFKSSAEAAFVYFQF